jgi:hypothetical protein
MEVRVIILEVRVIILESNFNIQKEFRSVRLNASPPQQASIHVYQRVHKIVVVTLYDKKQAKK